MLQVDEAQARIRSALRVLPKESVTIDECADRVAGEDLLASGALPPFDNSAMDGFAVRSADLPGSLPIVGTIRAGSRPEADLKVRTTWRIMTGGPVPSGADAVVPQEEVTADDDTAHFSRSPEAGAHIRRSGEDIAVGQRFVARGRVLGPGEIALAAALGCTHLPVIAQPRVALLATGDELVEVSAPPKPGQIVNSSAYALAVQVREAGGVPIALGIARDDPEALTAAIRRGLEEDVLLTTGGVSVGEYDYVRDAFVAAGVDLSFWKIAIKPGKPLAFGVAESGTCVFGLPGNPVSTMVSFEVFVRPALRAMLGISDTERPRVPVRLAHEWTQKRGRPHYVRASLIRDGDLLYADASRKQGSGCLSSMVGVDALLEIPVGEAPLPRGASVTAVLLRAI